MPHIHDKIDFTSEVFIVHNDKVLLRMHDKLKIWLSIGGHIELDEDPIEAAVREVKEEVGLDIKIPKKEYSHNTFDYKELIPPKFMNRHKINDNHEHVTLVYFATTDNDKIIAESHDKSDNHRWFSMKELEENNFGIRENVLFYAKEALKELAR